MTWISVEKRLPKGSGVMNVKRESGEVTKVYFHKDQMYPLARYWKDHELSHWQEKSTLKWLYDVIEWDRPEDSVY